MNPEILVILPCYKRPEYTAKCLKAIEEAQAYDNAHFYLVDDGSQDGTAEILRGSLLERKTVVVNPSNVGLRNVLIRAFEVARDYKFMVKMDNDCLVPQNWLKRTIDFLESGWVDVVSPNVHPSNAAYVYGQEDKEGRGIRPSKIVGGLWAMKTDLLDGVYFEPVSAGGIKGAFHLLNQILVEKEPRVGWMTDVTVEDIGHWSGEHPDHIKSDAHREYSVEVGRQIAW